MNLNPPVVVGIEHSTSAFAAMHWAAADAALHHAPLRIVHALYPALDYAPAVTFSAPVDFSALEQEAERMLAHAAEVVTADHPGLEVSTELLRSPRTPALIQASKDSRLTVVGTRGLGPMRRALVGSVGDALARHAHSPVVVVRKADATPSTDRRIVVGVDGTSNSVPAVGFAFDEASHRGARIVAIHAWSDIPATLDVPINWRAYEDGESVLLAEALAGYQERYPEVEVERVVVPNRAAQTIFERAEGAELVVVGSHGRGGFAGMMLGSTSLALLHNVECPIAIVPSNR